MVKIQRDVLDTVQKETRFIFLGRREYTSSLLPYALLWVRDLPYNPYFPTLRSFIYEVFKLMCVYLLSTYVYVGLLVSIPT